VIAVLGEDDSDVEMLKHLIWKLTGSKSIQIKTKGYRSKGAVFVKGRRDIETFAKLGSKFFIVCVDSDGEDVMELRRRMTGDLLPATEIGKRSCCVIPVQEIEAWILADLKAVTKVITSWNPKHVKNPESIPSPKEYLEKLSKAENKRPRYSHATHNEKVANHLDISILDRSCPSFKIFSDFIRSNFECKSSDHS